MKLKLRDESVYFGTGSGALDKDKPAMLFIHGAGFDHSVWVMPARFFARHGFSVLAPDLPGHGRSSGAALPTIEEMADWLAEFVVASGHERTHVVGHSMGSLAALSLAHRHPELVLQCALLGTSAPMPVGAPLLDAARDDDVAAFDMANTWSHSQEGRIGAGQNPGMSNFMSGARWLRRTPEGTYFHDLNACNEFQYPGQALQCPLLVVAGGEDKMTPLKSGMAVAESLGAEKVVTLPGCGHAMLNEKPNQVLDALAEFFRAST